MSDAKARSIAVESVAKKLDQVRHLANLSIAAGNSVVVHESDDEVVVRVPKVRIDGMIGNFQYNDAVGVDSAPKLKS